MSDVLIFLLQALFIVVLPPLLTHYLGLRRALPLVVVQILLGIALGPTLLGRVAPEFHRAFFNAEALGTLASLSSVAVLLFAFATGMHVDYRSLRGKGSALAMISAASMLVPTLLGVLAGLWIAWRHPALVAGTLGTTEFALGIGICCGVTALPVLAAILREMKLIGDRLGQYALAVAAMNDGVVWILLGILLAAARASGEHGAWALAAPLTLALYVALMFFVVRPLFAALARHAFDAADDDRADAALIAACGVALASAALTECLGLHYVLGAFVAGAIMPEGLRKPVLDRLQPLTVYVLVPFFFITTGLKTTIDMGSPAFGEMLLVITLFAVAGKVGGVALAARATGEAWPFAFALGSLAQTKGLMEVVVATILLDAGVLSPGVFSAVIAMAVASTALAMPLTRLALRQRLSTA